MKLSNAFRFAAVIGGLVLGSVTNADAATTSASFQVTASVQANCSISATGLAFGQYTGAAAVTSTSTLTVNCSKNTPYTIGLDQGTSSGATVRNRAMTGTANRSNTLSYGLFSDNAYSVTWGNSGTGLVSQTGTGLNQSITVYGQIPASQIVAPDSYKDTITATVTY
jgi:spore coat protein U-like protein